MTPEPYPIAAASVNEPHAAPGQRSQGTSRPEHRVGTDIDRNDQLSSIVLLGIAASGAAAALILQRLIIG